VTFPRTTGDDPGFLIRNGQTLVCLGDSITQNPQGYCRLLTSLIAGAYPERGIRVINAGVSGNKIGDMLQRLDRDVLAHDPAWVTVNVGINDVWHGLTGWGTGGTPLSQYLAGLGMLVERLVDAGARVVLLPPTVIEEDPNSEGNRRLKAYRAAMREIGQERGLLVAPTDRDFEIALAAGKQADPAYTLTTDGVHMSPEGDAVMALAVLKTLHFFHKLDG
jgi:lysophospholipase L1-like esterase